jgi:fructosamine-3-kinase
MHLAGQSDRFGFPTLTFCGATPLDNEMTDEPWSVWFARHRIGHILNQLGSTKATKRSVESVVARIAELLREHDKEVTPSLVHGDLWGGNGGNSAGTPCIFDPGCYYGDPEVDLLSAFSTREGEGKAQVFARSEFYAEFQLGVLGEYQQNLKGAF